MKIEVVEDINLRIDKYLSNKLENYTRNKIQRLIQNEKILVNNNIISNNYKVKLNDIIEINDDLTIQENLIPSDREIKIIYEDDDLLVINKESGMVVHPGNGNYQDTLVNALIGKYSLSSDAVRPGIVHRLDKDTSGLMLVAKNDYIHEKLSKMIQDRQVKRTYIALVEGTFNHETGTIDAPIGIDPKNRLKMCVTSLNSKSAITHFKVIKRYSNYTLLECQLETGRTHQIRVHMKYINHNIVNDPVYGKKINDNSFGQLLHSYKISFNHPRTLKFLEFKCDIPDEFNKLLKLVTEK